MEGFGVIIWVASAFGCWWFAKEMDRSPGWGIAWGIIGGFIALIVYGVMYADFKSKNPYHVAGSKTGIGRGIGSKVSNSMHNINVGGRQQQRACPTCGMFVDMNFHFCPGCGNQIPVYQPPQPVQTAPLNQDMYTCPTCGGFVTFGVAHCKNCGYKFGEWPSKEEEPDEEQEVEPEVSKDYQCVECGSVVQFGNMFCDTCGKEIGKIPE